MRGGELSPPGPISVLAPCRKCQGEGVIYWQGGPGTFDEGLGNYLPSEREGICPACDGDGEAVVLACPVCLEETSSCACSDDDIARYDASLDGADPLRRAA